MTGTITEANKDDPDVARIATTGCTGCLVPLGIGPYVAKITPECGFRRGPGQFTTLYFHDECRDRYQCEVIGQNDEPLEFPP